MQTWLREQVMKRTLKTLLTLLIGAATGTAASFLMWGMIYVIGNRVIQDQEYSDYESVVYRSGALAGALFASISVSIFKWPSLTLLLSYFVALAVFFVTPFACTSWKQGIGYFYLLILVSFACCFIWRQLRRKKNDKPTPPCAPD